MSCSQFSFVISCDRGVTTYFFFCPTAFRFPPKLAISAVVSFIALYQVLCPVVAASRYQKPVITMILSIVLFSGGPFTDFCSGAAAAEGPLGSG